MAVSLFEVVRSAGLVSAVELQSLEAQFPEGGAPLLRQLVSSHLATESALVELLGRESKLPITTLGDLFVLRREAGPRYRSLGADRAVWLVDGRVAIDDPFDPARLARLRDRLGSGREVSFVLVRTSELDAFFNPPVPAIAAALGDGDWPALLAASLPAPVRQTGFDGGVRLEAGLRVLEVTSPGPLVRANGAWVLLVGGPSARAGAQIAASVVEFDRVLASTRPLSAKNKARFDERATVLEAEGAGGDCAGPPEQLVSAPPSRSQQLGRACEALGFATRFGGCQRGELHLALEGETLVLSRVTDGWVHPSLRGTLRSVIGVAELDGVPEASVAPLVQAWVTLGTQLENRPQQVCQYCGEVTTELTSGACRHCAQALLGLEYQA